jgi:hypothetical protein
VRWRPQWWRRGVGPRPPPQIHNGFHARGARMSVCFPARQPSRRIHDLLVGCAASQDRVWFGERRRPNTVRPSSAATGKPGTQYSPPCPRSPLFMIMIHSNLSLLCRSDRRSDQRHWRSTQIGHRSTETSAKVCVSTCAGRGLTG